MITLEHECFDEVRRINKEIEEHEEAIRQLKADAYEIPFTLMERTDVDWKEALLLLYIHETVVRPSAIKEALGLKTNAEPKHVFKRLGVQPIATCAYCGKEFTIGPVSRDAIVGATRWQCDECKKERQDQEYARLKAQYIAKQEEEQRRIAALKAMPYPLYLQTDHWKETREKALRRARNRCQLCNGQYNLQVHHKTYENRGCERPEDLIVLCRTCHARHHEVVTVSLSEIQVQP